MLENYKLLVSLEIVIIPSRVPLNRVKMNVVEMLQKQFQDNATNLQTVQRDYSKVLADRQTLDSQLNENRQVVTCYKTFLSLKHCMCAQLSGPTHII